MSATLRRLMEFIFETDHFGIDGDGAETKRWEDERDPKLFGAELATCLIELFDCSDELVLRYPVDRIGKGLQYINAAPLSGINQEVFSRAVAIPLQVKYVLAHEKLFSQIFDKHCEPILSHLDEPCRVPDLNGACYMWWDSFSYHPGLGTGPEVAEALMEVYEYCLYLPNDACRESALHAYNHCYKYDQPRIAKIIDDFLQKNAGTIRPELVSYAVYSKEGLQQ